MKRKITTTSAWLGRLGQLLVKYFSGRQAVEMLTDYAGHFSLGLERGESEAALLEAMGAPEAAADALIRENWPVRPDRRRYLWWGLLAVSAWLYWGILRSYYGSGFGEYNSRLAVLPALLLGPLALFQCLRGRTRAEVEGAFPLKAPSLLPHILTVAAALGAAVFFWYWITSYADQWVLDSRGWWTLTPQGERLAYTFELLWWVPKLVLFWSLWRSVTASIRYLPCAVHAAGVMMYLVCLECAVTCNELMTAESRARGQREVLLYSLFYLASAAVALAYGLYIRRCGKRGAAWTRS